MYKSNHDKVKSETSFTGFYRGEVVDSQDPMQANRVKIRVFSVFDDMSDASLPWAIMADPFMGGQEGFGGCFIPDVGSHVWVFFETGDPSQPVYFAGAPARPHGPPEKSTNYPYNHVYKTRTGHLIEINDGDSNHMRIKHNSGTMITINGDGSVNINTVGDVTHDISGNLTENVSGNVSIDAGGDISIQSGGRIDLN